MELQKASCDASIPQSMTALQSESCQQLWQQAALWLLVQAPEAAAPYLPLTSS